MTQKYMTLDDLEEKIKELKRSLKSVSGSPEIVVDYNPEIGWNTIEDISILKTEPGDADAFECGGTVINIKTSLSEIS